MLVETFEGLPARPPAVAEWEDLLYRVELMNRALRVTLEDETTDNARIAAVLRDAVTQEIRLYDWLRDHAGAADQHTAPRPPVAAAGDHIPELVETFIGFRTRSFAMLQRRGLEVWDWQGPFGDSTNVTVYQLLIGIVRTDGELLATLRSHLRSGADRP